MRSATVRRVASRLRRCAAQVAPPRVYAHARAGRVAKMRDGQTAGCSNGTCDNIRFDLRENVRSIRNVEIFSFLGDSKVIRREKLEGKLFRD